MKKIILVTFVAVMIISPCFAQESDPDGLFTIEGTRWGRYSITFGIILPIPGPLVYFRKYTSTIGFHQGMVYMCDEDDNCSADPDFSYINLPGISVVSYSWSSLPIVPPSWTVELAILQPSGFGIYIGLDCIFEYIGIGFMYESGIMYKVADDWVPPETIVMIDPWQGEQGTTLTNVHIFAKNTTFRDNPPVEINFDPPNGLIVTNISAITNEVIAFDLDIDVAAPIGERYVSVTYDEGNKSVESSDVAFRVTEPQSLREIVSISPHRGEQGTTLTGIIITGIDTTFDDDPPVEILFIPSEGLTTSNVNVISQTEVAFDLTIATDTPIGLKNVIVTYDYGTQFVAGIDAFEVSEKTN